MKTLQNNTNTSRIKKPSSKANKSERTGVVYLIAAPSCTTSNISYLRLSPSLRTASSKQKAFQPQITSQEGLVPPRMSSDSSCCIATLSGEPRGCGWTSAMFGAGLLERSEGLGEGCSEPKPSSHTMVLAQ